MSNTYIRDPTGGGVGRGRGGGGQKKKRRYVHVIKIFFFFLAPPLLPLLLPGSKGIFKLISMHSLFS